MERETVDKWRQEVATAMVAYNFGTRLWEWVSLDLYDVLLAQRAHLGRKEFAGFYSRAIGVAALDPAASHWKPSAGNNIADALFAVLLDWYPRQEDGSLKDFSKRWSARTEQIQGLKQNLAAQLTSAYSEPHRRYHTVTHVNK